MQIDDLLRLRGEAPVDEIVGQIIQIDAVKKDIPSRFGPKQTAQDVVFQTPDRRRYVIAFYDLNIRCFTKHRDDGDKPQHFKKGTDEDRWVRIRNTGKDDSKPTLRKLSDSNKTVLYWKQFGVEAVLKATGTVDAHWLLETGQKAPQMGETRYVKKPPAPLHVPGQEPPPTTPRPETERADKPALNEEKYMATPQEMTQAVAVAASFAHSAISAAYEKREDITVPKGDELVRVVSTIMIALKDKTNILREEETHLKRCAWFLANVYVDQHLAVLDAFRGNDDLRDERLISLITTCFIQSSRELRMPEKPRPNRRDDRRDRR